MGNNSIVEKDGCQYGVCSYCDRHITRDLGSDTSRWFHTPSADYPQPTDHKASPKGEQMSRGAITHLNSKSKESGICARPGCRRRLSHKRSLVDLFCVVCRDAYEAGYSLGFSVGAGAVKAEKVLNTDDYTGLEPL